MHRNQCFTNVQEVAMVSTYVSCMIFWKRQAPTGSFFGMNSAW